MYATDQTELHSSQDKKSEEGMTSAWKPWKLLAFRFTAAFLTLFWLTTYGLFNALPVVGSHTEDFVDGLWQRPVLWIGVHVFHPSSRISPPTRTSRPLLLYFKQFFSRQG